MNDDCDEGIDDMDEDEISESEMTKAKEVSSQMVLLCAWRSVKELSLFLGELSSSFRDGDTNLVTVKQITDIAKFLVDLLTDTKHRGAFEQAFVAFSQLCGFMWRSSNQQLHSQPQRMLDDVLESVTDVKKSSRST